MGSLCRNPETELSESMFWGLPLVPGGILSHLGLYFGAVWPQAQLQREVRLWMWNDGEDSTESIRMGVTEPALVGTLSDSQSVCLTSHPSCSLSSGLATRGFPVGNPLRNVTANPP